VAPSKKKKKISKIKTITRRRQQTAKPMHAWQAGTVYVVHVVGKPAPRAVVTTVAAAKKKERNIQRKREGNPKENAKEKKDQPLITNNHNTNNDNHNNTDVGK
jgi:hypothetical protein